MATTQCYHLKRDSFNNIIDTYHAKMQFKIIYNSFKAHLNQFHNVLSSIHAQIPTNKKLKKFIHFRKFSNILLQVYLDVVCQTIYSFCNRIKSTVSDKSECVSCIRNFKYKNIIATVGYIQRNTNSLSRLVPNPKRFLVLK